MPAPIALFDMDGTLFDFEGRMRADLARLRSPGEPDPQDASNLLWGDASPWLKARMELIRSVPGWWRTLPKLQLGWDIYEIARELGYAIHILTKGPSWQPHAWAEKVECIKLHFGSEVTIHLTENKSVHYGRVLVDDYGPFVEGWLEHRARGLAIMPTGPGTAPPLAHANVVSYNGSRETLVLVKQALAAAFQRESGEHWRNFLPGE